MNREQAVQLLHATFCAIGGGQPPPEQWRRFAQALTLRDVSKGAHLLRSGEQATVVSFVCSGLFRLFYLCEGGKELNKAFVPAGDFAASFEALLGSESSRLSIECLKDAQVLEMRYAAVRALHEQDVFWQRLGRCIAERLYVKKARREAELLMDSAKDRYLRFVEEHPGLAEQVASYHVASYLGITAEALSRLKKSLRS